MNSIAPMSAYRDTDTMVQDIVDQAGSEDLAFTALNEDAPPGTRAVLYLRVSSKGQVNTDYDPEGISIPAQREACLRKVEQMGLTVVTEYIEPGRSATEMTKRVAFQEMLRRVRADRDVDYVVVYKLSRFARNRTDDAIVMADLKKRGVTLISATESIDASPVGQLMHGLLAAFNEYRSAEDGADIKYKMAQKAKKGGTIGRAPVGYLNVREYFEGREVRSVAIDEVRGPLIRQAFELYATGDYTFTDLSEAMEDRGLTTKPSAKRPSKAIAPTYFSRLLRDRYYCGIITLDGAEHPGRHEALVSDELFDKVQRLLDSRGVAGERRRVHEHYLKGTLYCDNCHQRGIVHRMVIQRSIGRSGNEYFYFFCAGRTIKDCSTSHISTARLEDAVITEYGKLQFTPDFIDLARTRIREALREKEAANLLLKKQLAATLKECDSKEENLLDLAADGTIAKEKIRTRLTDIERQRTRVREQLDSVESNLEAGARHLETYLDLLEDPEALYRSAGDQERRQLNQAIFVKVLVEDEEIIGTLLSEPMATLAAAHAGHQALQAGASRAVALKSAQTFHDAHSDTKKGTTRSGDSLLVSVEDLLDGIHEVDGSNKVNMVELRRFELLTSSMRTKRSTN